MGQKIVKFAKTFRDLLAQLLVDIDQFDHPRRCSCPAGLGTRSGLARCIDARHGGFDACKGSGDAVSTHGSYRYQENDAGAKLCDGLLISVRPAAGR
jgi:hypothetical protein